VSDFARFVAAVIQGQGLRPTTREALLTPQVRIRSKHQFPTLSNDSTTDNDSIRLSYGLGWGLYWTPFGKAFFKEGHAPGCRNYVVGFDHGTGLVILTNSSNGEGIFPELVDSLLGNRYTPIEWEGFTPYQLLPPRPALKEHHEIVVDPSLLDVYVGRYGGGSAGVVIAVTREGDHLAIRENEEPRQEIFAERPRDFFSRSNDDELSFEVDAKGHVAAMVLHVAGRDVRLERLQ
jgi:hypothetical protein